MINRFYFNGEDSRKMGIFISERKIFGSPARDVEYVSIPGRSGDLIVDKGRYKNTTIEYSVSIFRNVADKIRVITEWLNRKKGYVELWDTYDPDYYRYASFSNGFDAEDGKSGIATFKITFNCKPYRYKIDGAGTIATTKKTLYINNPESIESKPKIQVTGSGENGYITLTGNTQHPNNQQITISKINGYIDIDAESQTATKGTENLNGVINTADIILVPGENRIEIGGAINKISIQPRWRTL